MSFDIHQIKDKIAAKSDLILQVKQEVNKVLVGQADVLDRMLIALLARGHILLEGVPGLAKTTLIKTISEVVSTQFQRIQFTPDLLPADLIGTQIYNPQQGTFSMKKGPIFANFILADEINRAPAKVQSALLEAMQEHQVTIGGEIFPLDQPFLVMATQNPIEQEGTYPLPEAQVDRFMLKVLIQYPDKADEKVIMTRNTSESPKTIHPIISAGDLLACQDLVREIYVDDKILDYIIDIVTATRKPDAFNLPLSQLIEYGASPRASIYLNLAARANAFLAGRGYVSPQDVKTIAHDILRHRIIISYEAEAEEKTSDDLIQTILDRIPVP